MIVYFSCNYFHFFRIENLGLKESDMILPQPNNVNSVGNERESIFHSTVSIFLKQMIQIHINLESNFTMTKQKNFK